MDDYKKDLIRNNVDLAARVIFAVNSFGDERNPFSKLKAALELGSNPFGGCLEAEFIDNLNKVAISSFSYNKSDLRKFYAALEEAYTSGIINMKYDTSDGFKDEYIDLILNFLKAQDEEDYVSPEIKAEVEQMMKDIEDGKDIDEDDEDFYDIDDFDDGYGDDEEPTVVEDTDTGRGMSSPYIFTVEDNTEFVEEDEFHLIK